MNKYISVPRLYWGVRRPLQPHKEDVRGTGHPCLAWRDTWSWAEEMNLLSCRHTLDVTHLSMLCPQLLASCHQKSSDELGELWQALLCNFRMLCCSFTEVNPENCSSWMVGDWNNINILLKNPSGLKSWCSSCRGVTGVFRSYCRKDTQIYQKKILAVLGSEFPQCVFEDHPWKSWVRWSSFLNCLSKSFEWLIIFVCATIIHIGKIFSCWSSQALKQGFVFHNTLWLLRWLHFVLAHGINFSGPLRSCHCCIADSLYHVQWLNVFSPGFPLVIRLQKKNGRKEDTAHAGLGSLMMLGVTCSVREHLLC